MPHFAGDDFLRRNTAGLWQQRKPVTEVSVMGPASILGVTSIAMLVGFSPVVTAQDGGRNLEQHAKQRANRYAEETSRRG